MKNTKMRIILQRYIFFILNPFCLQLYERKYNMLRMMAILKGKHFTIFHLMKKSNKYRKKMKLALFFDRLHFKNRMQWTFFLCKIAKENMIVYRCSRICNGEIWLFKFYFYFYINGRKWWIILKEAISNINLDSYLFIY